jgi:hypothetical protein
MSGNVFHIAMWKAQIWRANGSIASGRQRTEPLLVGATLQIDRSF